MWKEVTPPLGKSLGFFGGLRHVGDAAVLKRFPGLTGEANSLGGLLALNGDCVMTIAWF